MLGRLWELILNLLKNDNRYRLIVFIVILLTGVVLWVFRISMLFGLFANPHGGSVWFSDFSFYYNAARLHLSGEGIYDNTGFLYPPLSIILFLPFCYLSFDQACFLMAIFNMLLLFSTIILISRIITYYGVQLSKIKLLLIFIAIFLFYPISTSFIGGQINILILFVVTLFYYYLFVKGKKTVASVLLSIATVIKIWPFILVFLNFVTKRAKGLFARYCLIFGILCIVSLWLFDVPMHANFFRQLVNFQSIPLQTPDDVLHPKDALENNVSPSNSIVKLLSIFGMSNFRNLQLLFGLKLVFILLLLYYLHKSSDKISSHEGEILTFSSLIILVLIASNVTWIHYGSSLVLPYLLFLFVLKLEIMEKSLLIAPLILFSIQEYIIFLSNTLGGKIVSIVYIASPTTYAYLLFLILVFYSISTKTKVLND
jgi:hypothetical protein